MPTIVETLQPYSKPLPDWLRQPKSRFDRESFFRSRTVYYPGYGTDAHPVKVCAEAHAAHAFVYVDYGVSKETVRDCVYRRRGPGFQGYEVEHDEEVVEAVLHPVGWRAYDQEAFARAAEWSRVEPFRLYAVLKRDKDHDDAHGPERLAMLFVGGDGFAMYDALYCQGDGTPPPFLVLVHDYSWGENHDQFRARGLLEQIAIDRGVYPEWLMVGEYNGQFEPWEGYLDTGAEPEPGGIHGKPRRLFRRDPWPAVGPRFR